VYVAFIIGVFSRMVIGWQASTSLRADLAIDALEMAVATRGRTDERISSPTTATTPTPTPLDDRRASSTPMRDQRSTRRLARFVGFSVGCRSSSLVTTCRPTSED